MPQPYAELEIWKTGYLLVLRVYWLTSDFSPTERYGLTQQLRRFANSIIANIAESQGRYTYKDRIRVLYQARGEILETMSHLRIAEGLKYIDTASFKKLDALYGGLLKGINTYIRYLAKKQETIN